MGVARIWEVPLYIYIFFKVTISDINILKTTIFMKKINILDTYACYGVILVKNFFENTYD